MSQSKSSPATQKAAFTQGSTMRHVVVMTATASIGLVSIFFVDALNLFYISLLGQQELAAAIGYAGTIMFFSISICIGISIATAALVGRAIGAGQADAARSIASVSLVYLLIISGLFALALYPFLADLLRALGAEGETLILAERFMQIVVPSIPLLGLGMSCGALLRAKGDPKRAMYVTLSGGVAALFLDPLLIFGFDLGLEGAAWAIVLVRCILVIVGLWGVQKVHNMLGPLYISDVINRCRPFMGIAVPAIATQLATPVGNAYVTQAIAEFGDDAVAGWAIVGRMIPVAFGTIFALSGSVGPILSQNYGARLFERVNSTLRDALIFTLIYCLAVWALLALLAPQLVTIFSAEGEAARLIYIFCYLVAASFLFNGALFVANSAFNNLGFPLLATLFNWGRATLGVVPFVIAAKPYGATGVLVGWGLGGVLFGIFSVITAFVVIRRLPQRTDSPAQSRPYPPTANSAFSSGKGATFSASSPDQLGELDEQKETAESSDLGQRDEQR